MSSDPSVDRHDDVDRRHDNHGLPDVLAHRLKVLAALIVDDPFQRDEPVVNPVELEEDGQEEGGGCVDEDRVDRAGEGRGVLEQGEVD